MTDYTTEITALNEAIASGMLKVSYDGRSWEYGSFKDLIARKNYLESLTVGGQARPSGAFASFDRGDY